jgi:hypothetical protein
VQCHRHLLDADHSLRRENHEKYFGRSDKLVDWYDGTEISAEQYLANKIFDRTLNNEKVVIVSLLYSDIQSADLWEFLAQQSRIGDFCLIHLERNPLLSFVDEKKITCRVFAQLQENRHLLQDYVQEHDRFREKLNRSCRDRVTLSYKELLLDYRRTCRRLCRFLGLEQTPDYPPVPSISGTFISQTINTISQVESGCDFFTFSADSKRQFADLF